MEAIVKKCKLGERFSWRRKQSILNAQYKAITKENFSIPFVVKKNQCGMSEDRTCNSIFHSSSAEN